MERINKNIAETKKEIQILLRVCKLNKIIE